MSNLGFENYLENSLNLKLIRTSVGDVNVIKEIKENKYSLGGEQSGHIIISEYSKTGDGILVALKILEALTESKLKTSELFDLYEPFPQEKINLSFNKKLSHKLKNDIEKVSQSFKKKKPHLRYLIRESGTEPLLRLLVEGKNKLEVKQEINILSNKVKEFLNE